MNKNVILKNYAKTFYGRTLVILYLALSLSMTISAQTSRGTVSGTVKDPNGAVVPGATVTLINAATSVERTVTTNDEDFIVLMRLTWGVIQYA